MTSVCSIILNTNRLADTLECLDSLRLSDYADQQSIVVLNACTDGSGAAIRARFPDVIMLETEQNLGYAGGNNLGIAYALEYRADYFFVLNEDAVVGPACISTLVRVMQDEREIGMAGPLTYHYDEPNRIQSAGGYLAPGGRSAHRGRDETDVGQFQTVDDVEWLQGSAIMVRADVVRKIGLLDERFFMSWEDVDWCFRARRAGYRIVCVPQARIWHKGAGLKEPRSPRMTYYRARNRLLFLRKHGAGSTVLLRVLFGEYLRTALAWTLRPRWRAMRAERKALILAVADFLKGRYGRVDVTV